MTDPALMSNRSSATGWIRVARSAITAAVPILVAVSSSAVNFETWNFASSKTGAEFSVPTVSGLYPSTISRAGTEEHPQPSPPGAGLEAPGTLWGLSWAGNTPLGTLDTYFQFSINAPSSAQYTISGITFGAFRFQHSGPPDWTLYYSTDGNNFSQAANWHFPHEPDSPLDGTYALGSYTGNDPDVVLTIDDPDLLTALRTGPVTFRIFASGSEAGEAGLTFLKIDGEVLGSAVPETLPSSCFGIVAAGLFVISRRLTNR